MILPFDKGDTLPYGTLTFRFQRCGPVAQLVEHVTFNHVVVGSSPTRLTISLLHDAQNALQILSPVG